MRAHITQCVTGRARMLTLPCCHQLLQYEGWGEGLHCSSVGLLGPHRSLLELYQVRIIIQVCRLDTSPEGTQQEDPDPEL